MLGRKNKDTPPETIPLAAFVLRTDERLAYADDANTPLITVVAGAKLVQQQVAQVKAGELAIIPPLEDDRLAMYDMRAQTIISVGERAIGALAEAEANRPEDTAAAQTAVEAKQPFTGQGSLAKS